MRQVLLPRMLLIAGTGRNSGKTSVACKVIAKFSADFPVVAIKISSHRHKLATGGRIIADDNLLYMAEETDPGTGKDSSRMLAAGARRSFFAVAPADQLLVIMKILIDQVGPEAFIVCESGGLRQWVVPGLFIMVEHKSRFDHKPDPLNIRNMADTRIHFDNQQTDDGLDRIGILDNSWKIDDSHDSL